MDTADPPPGPANLLQDAIERPNSSPLLPSTSSNSAPPPHHARLTPVDMVPSSSGDSATTGSNEPGPKAVTTVTTVTEGGGNATTQTFTHVGASAIDAKLSSETGRVELRPIPVKGLSASKIKTLRSRRTKFVPRISHFDRDNTSSAQDPFRGFWTLFWIVIFVGGVRTGYRHFVETGSPFGRKFADLISEDGWALALSDAALVGSTLLCVPFAKLLVSGWIPYYWTGLIIQHIGQTAFLGIAVSWTFHRNWPWVQSGFMTLHALSLLMKVHSYCATVGEMTVRHRRLTKDEAKLEALLSSHGGRRQAELDARAAWEQACAEKPSLASDRSASFLNPSTTSAIDSTPTSSINSDEETHQKQQQLRQRLTRRKSSDHRSPTRQRLSASDEAAGAPLIHHPSRDEVPQEGPETLTWHPNSEISETANAVAEGWDALTSDGVGKVRFPENVTGWNFVDYLLVPTLVYELEYPRAESIRPLYILEKTLATFGTFSILVLIVEHFILPVTPSKDDSFVSSILDLALPFCVCYLLIFFIIFECVCNGFAEITRFSDRAFYSDWWNSISFDEFSRKWNRPVHTFLLRHVYATTITSYHFSKFSAAFVTFLLSALVHELVMAVVTKKIRLYLFGLQMAQLPLIMIGRAKIFRQYPALGNLFFWLGLLSGFPLLAVSYLKY
ncbi:hypothetical protein JCM11641_006162 [Rhodosporidiobolus odoratus]